MNIVDVLGVFLNEVEVGTLTRLMDDRILFAFSESYFTMQNRPVLSQSFYDKMGELRQDIRPTLTAAPPFFSNLLPEGPLREYLATQGNISPKREFFLLALLGADLPGAVRLVPLQGALNTASSLFGEKRMDRFNMAAFTRLAVKLGLPESKVTEPLQQFAGQVRSTWRVLKDSFPLGESIRINIS